MISFVIIWLDDCLSLVKLLSVFFFYILKWPFQKSHEVSVNGNLEISNIGLAKVLFDVFRINYFLTNFTQKDWFWLYSGSCHIGMYIFFIKINLSYVDDRGKLTIFLVYYFYDRRVKCDSNAKNYLYGLSNKVLWMNKHQKWFAKLHALDSRRMKLYD